MQTRARSSALGGSLVTTHHILPTRTLTLSCALLLLATAVAFGQSPTRTVEGFFTAYEDYFKKLAADETVVKGSVAKVNAIFRTALGEHPSLNTLMRVNSKGRVINEIKRSGKPGKANRSVARQKWFAAATKKMEPYFGHLRPSRGPATLFWAFPITMARTTGEIRSAGALLCKIEVPAAFKAASANLNVPLSVDWDGTTVYAKNGGAPDDAKRTILGIRGLMDCTLRLGDPAAAAAVTPPPADSQPVAAAATEPEPAPEKEEEQSGSLISELDPKAIQIAIAVGVGLVVLLLFGGIFALIHAGRKRHQRLMAEIDGAPSKQRKPPTAAMPSVGTPRPPTRSMQVAETGKKLSRNTEKHVIPPTVSGMPAVEAEPPARVKVAATPRHQADPTAKTLAEGSPVVTPDMYEQIRQQLSEEISAKLRTQLQQEFENERRKLSARAEVFNRTVQTHIGDLVNQLTEAESRWSEMSVAMKNSAFKLKQALDGLTKSNGMPG